MRLYSSAGFRNESVFAEIFLKRLKGKRRGNYCFCLVTWLLFMGRSSVSARTSLRESMATSKTSLSPHSIRNAVCMVMQPNPTIRWSRLTGTSRQQTDSMAVSMLRQHPAQQSHPLTHTIRRWSWSLKLIPLHRVAVEHYRLVTHRLKPVTSHIKFTILLWLEDVRVSAVNNLVLPCQ